MYSVIDAIEAEYTLEPLVCLFCGSEEVTYNQGVADAYCAECGRWQLEEE